MVAMPQWADQLTTAKYVDSAWGMGLPMRKGLVKREEVERCIREVMDGDRKQEYRWNAAQWKQRAKEAMQEGGSSDKNIAEFASKYLSMSMSKYVLSDGDLSFKTYEGHVASV